MFRSFAEIIAAARGMNRVKLAVAAAADADVLTAVSAAKQAGIADAILVGDAEAIARICRKEGVNSESFEIEHEPDVRLAARRAAAARSAPFCRACAPERMSSVRASRAVSASRRSAASRAARVASRLGTLNEAMAMFFCSAMAQMSRRLTIIWFPFSCPCWR